MILIHYFEGEVILTNNSEAYHYYNRSEKI